ncbi:LiaI-LiaF-like domain-containing protein [Chloroflexota bacterium]
MPEEKQSGEHHIPLWGIFLLFLGIVFLLQSLNVLPWVLWETLWRFWPVLIIIGGLGILLRHYNVWLTSTLIAALLFACLGIAIWQHGTSPPPGQSTQSYSEPLDSLEQAQIEVDFTAGSLTMSSLPPGSLNFVEIESNMKNENAGMKVDFHRQGGEGTLYLSKERVNQPFWDEDDNKWQVRLTRNIPLTLNIKSAASNMELTLDKLKVTEFRVKVDAGNCKLIMPSSAGDIHAYINAGVANVEVDIPDGVAARIQVDTDLTALDMNESRFSKKGGYYISDDFDTAQNRIYLEIESDVGRVQVK